MANEISQDEAQHCELAKQRTALEYAKFENGRDLKDTRAFVGRLRETVERNGLLKYAPELEAMRAKETRLKSEDERLSALDLELLKQQSVLSGRVELSRSLARQFNLTEAQSDLLAAHLAQTEGDRGAARRLAQSMGAANKREVSSAITHSFNEAPPGEEMVRW